ncbi:MAG: hypothetical protein FWD17_08505 [Polyangiaceae bacterium]|nr:hypothetical protein [Polyangiaceae bacterium]
MLRSCITVGLVFWAPATAFAQEKAVTSPPSIVDAGAAQDAGATQAATDVRAPPVSQVIPPPAGSALAPLPPPPAGAASTPTRLAQSPSPAAGEPNARRLSAQPTPNATRSPWCFRHDGFYLSVSNGTGYGDFAGRGPNGDASLRNITESASAAVGGTIARGWVLAGTFRFASLSATFHGGPQVTAAETSDVNGTTVTTVSTPSGASVSLFELGPLVDWFPNPEDGWHVGASFGLGGLFVTDAAERDLESLAWVGSLFGGYQFWLGPRWSLGIQGMISGVTSAKLTDSRNNDTGYRMGGLTVGLETVLLYY